MNTVLATAATPSLPTRADGMPLTQLGSNVVLADALAVLAKTNLRTVVRLLVAIDVLNQHFGRGDNYLKPLLAPHHAPLESPMIHPDDRPELPRSPIKQARVVAVDELMEALRDDENLLAQLAFLRHH